MTAKGKKIVAMSVLLAPFLVMLAFYLSTEPSITPLRRYHPLRVGEKGDTVYHTIPKTSYEDATGKRIDLGNMGDNAWIGHFFPVPCGDTCQALFKRLQTLQDAFKPKAHIRLVSLGVPQQNKGGIDFEAISDKYAIQPDKWSLIKSQPGKALRLARKGFLWEVDDPNALTLQRPYRHQVVMIDRKGIIRGTYNVMDELDLKKLRNEAVVLLKYNTYGNDR